MTKSPSPSGIVLNYHSNFYTVKVDEIEYQCFLKGNLKKEGTDVLVGDHVAVDSLDETNLSGRITSVLERKNQLSRPKVSNIDQALIVASIQSPELDFEQVDRFLTHVQLAGVLPAVCISKVDLAESDTVLQDIQQRYETLNIPVFSTTIKDPGSVSKVFEGVSGKIIVLAGMSGVGKSSLINAISPEQNLAVGEVSEKIQRGQHTTRQASLITLPGETYVVDTPGFSYLKFDTVSPQALEAVYPDFTPFRGQCRFQDCLHLDEEDCVVKPAMEGNSRYDHYCIFQTEAKDYVERVQTTSQKEEYGYKTLKKGKNEALQILKLKEKQRESSRRTQKQQIALGMDDDDDTLDTL